MIIVFDQCFAGPEPAWWMIPLVMVITLIIIALLTLLLWFLFFRK